MNASVWIIIGIISGVISAFSIPYGFYLKSQKEQDPPAISNQIHQTAGNNATQATTTGNHSPVIIDQRKVEIKPTIQKPSKKNIDNILVNMRIMIDSNNFSIFADDPKIQQMLLVDTKLKWEHYKTKNTLGRYPMWVHQLMKKESIQDKIRKYIFNDWHVRFNLKSKNNTAYIQPNEINGDDQIHGITLFSTYYENDIFYYNIQVEYLIKVDDEVFYNISGFDGSYCKITLDTPKRKDIKAEFIHIQLQGPNKRELDKAYLKAQVNISENAFRHTIIGDIKAPDNFSKTYKDL